MFQPFRLKSGWPSLRLPRDRTNDQRVRPAATLLERRRGDAVGAGFRRREDDARVEVVRGDVVILGDQRSQVCWLRSLKGWHRIAQGNALGSGVFCAPSPERA